MRGVLLVMVAACGGASPPPPPTNAPGTEHWQVVPQGTLKRSDGDTRIIPDDLTRHAMAEAGRSRVEGELRVCVDESGRVVAAQVVRSTDFADYDRKLDRRVRAWRFEPYRDGERAVPVCTPQTFIFMQTSGPTVIQH